MKTQISLCIYAWNNSHLFWRSVRSLLWQDIDPSLCEVIVVDDNSMDDVEPVLALLTGKVKVSLIRLTHKDGFRGPTLALDRAYQSSVGVIFSVIPPDCILPKDGVRRLLEAHYESRNSRSFVAMRTCDLTAGMQKSIDSVNWKDGDLSAFGQLPGWSDLESKAAARPIDDPVVFSVQRHVFVQMSDWNGYPYFGDCSTDLWLRQQRKKHFVSVSVLPGCMAVRQWSPPFQYWLAKGKAPNINRFGHSTSNYLGDRSGFVPDGGMCEVWDQGNRESLTDSEKAQWLALESDFLATGASPNTL